jgi:hypothetical protein
MVAGAVCQAGGNADSKSKACLLQPDTHRALQATKEVPLPACNDDSEQCQDWAKAGEVRMTRGPHCLQALCLCAVAAWHRVLLINVPLLIKAVVCPVCVLQCTANAAFMREQCRLSCGVCCPEGDVLCERRRRRFVPQD